MAEALDPAFDYQSLVRAEPFDFGQIRGWLERRARTGSLLRTAQVAALKAFEVERSSALARRIVLAESAFGDDAMWLLGYIAGVTIWATPDGTAGPTFDGGVVAGRSAGTQLAAVSDFLTTGGGL